MPLHLTYHGTSQSRWNARAKAAVQIVVVQHLAAAGLRLQRTFGQAKRKECCFAGSKMPQQYTIQDTLEDIAQERQILPCMYPARQQLSLSINDC